MRNVSYDEGVSDYDFDQLRTLTRRTRGRILELYAEHQIAHLGSCLSVVEILSTLMARHLRDFSPEVFDPNGDALILSKGHAAVALYCLLEEFGFVGSSEIENMAGPGSKFEEHPNFHIPTVLTATGSLGHGLPFANGLALAGKVQGLENRIFVVMSDGECNEGTVWEACLFANANNLANVTVLVDNNGWQATGRITETMPNLDLSEMFRSFGWHASEIDGHNLEALDDALVSAKSDGRPSAIVCKTRKGKGVSFMEDDNNWHYRAPNQTELESAMRELQIRYA
jgi:transketolase